MNPTPEELDKGMRSYERALAFARIRTWRLPLSYAAFVLAPVITAAYLWNSEYASVARLNLAGAFILATVEWFHWKWLRTRNTEDVALLARLKEEHGDQLPWVQVENHFAELERLKSEPSPDK